MLARSITITTLICILILSAYEFRFASPTENLNISNWSERSVLLSWQAPANPGRVDRYEIYRNDKKIGETTGLQFQVTGLTQNVAQTFKVYTRETADTPLMLWSTRSTPYVIQVRGTQLTHFFRPMKFSESLQPMLVDGKMYVAVAPFAEQIGVSIHWSAQPRTLILAKDDERHVFSHSILQYLDRSWLPLTTLTKKLGYQLIVHPTVAQTPSRTSIHLDVPLILQKPELYNGCEITSVAMLLAFAGQKVNKVELASKMPKDPTPIRKDTSGKAVFWGNPNVGFVGDVTGKRRGYAIYHQPMHRFLKTYIPSAIDLTGSPFVSIERKLLSGKPVVAWTSVHYNPPYNWVYWQSPSGTVRATFEEHAVVLTGVDKQFVYLNDPLSAKKHIRIEKTRFIRGWQALGKQAISY
jgi:uncharacterized protein YvpB